MVFLAWLYDVSDEFVRLRETDCFAAHILERWERSIEGLGQNECTISERFGIGVN